MTKIRAAALAAIALFVTGAASARDETTEIAALFSCYTDDTSGIPDECATDKSLIFSSMADCERLLSIEPRARVETTIRGTHVVKFVCMRKSIPVWEENR